MLDNGVSVNMAKEVLEALLTTLPIECFKICSELEDIGSLLVAFMEGMLDDRLGTPKDLSCQEQWGFLTNNSETLVSSTS